MKVSRRQIYDRFCSCGQKKKEYITGKGEHVYHCRRCNTIKLARARFKKLTKEKLILRIERTERDLFLLNQALGFKLKEEIK